MAMAIRSMLTSRRSLALLGALLLGALLFLGIRGIDDSVTKQESVFFTLSTEHLNLREYSWKKVSTPTAIGLGQAILVGTGSSAVLRYEKASLTPRYIADLMRRRSFGGMDKMYVFERLGEERIINHRYDAAKYSQQNCSALITDLVGNIYVSGDPGLTRELSAMDLDEISLGRPVATTQ